MELTQTKANELINEALTKHFATTISQATPMQIYKSIAFVVRDILLKKKQKNNQTIQKNGQKRVYYLCMEFLIGRSMKNNLYNLGLEKVFTGALKKHNIDINDLYELEADAGLGNGGLGRLASCFMDSLSTENYPAMGFSILYEYGLFQQKIVDNKQIELPDLWLDSGEVWMMPRSDKRFTIKLGGNIVESWENGRMVVRHENARIVEATPYDVMISGYDSKGATVLRLWKASQKKNFDMLSFNQGDYFTAMKDDNEAELISKVLYPSDALYVGKQLRLTQQYFLVSASLQCIIKDHLKHYGTLDNLEKKIAIHINDTHPALAVPELMRLLLDEYGFSWEDAWYKTVNIIAYTNHTVMSEALEKWDDQLVRMLLPRIYTIIKEIDMRFEGEHRGLPQDKMNNMRILFDNKVRMANLSVIGSHSINGVSALHSDIIKNSIFKDFYDVLPERFTNVTNGIAHRRWLNQSNPRLANLIDELIGEDYKKDASNLEKLLAFKDDKDVLLKLKTIKNQNKVDFAKYIKNISGFTLNPNSRFDTQIKRLHEYKRQLLNVLKIIGKILDIKDNPNKDVTPETFIFGAKAAGGYFHAKRIISLINCISADIQKDKALKDKIDVLFIENYNVTKAEHLIPASEVSEQISLAGKEASGTSNMKFMLNGALTLGTIDGANVEILEQVGNDNMFTFGLTTEQVNQQWTMGYNAGEIYAHTPHIRRIVDRLKAGFCGQSFADIADYLCLGRGYVADPYMCLRDYDDYIRASNDLNKAYSDDLRWNKMSLINIAKSGIFAADRSIDEYAKNIWHLTRVEGNK